MANYNFEVLSPAEFEELSRDLLQKELKVHVESFTTGRDGGIDLRCAIVPGQNIIIQAKRYKSWGSLKSELSKEVAKVQALNPAKYIITTSVGLTPHNKDEIKNMFSPYIKATADIYGRDDINNLLGKHGDVEKNHFKLWLSSTNVLERIVHRDVMNWDDFKLEEIKKKLSLYVINNSFPEALKILKEHNYVIISGIPGIGKTTLAQMLAYDLLAHDFEEFHFIPGDIDNAAKAFEKGKKQIFFFDDFLGATALESHESGFIEKLLLLIRAIQNDKTKALILTTREYILSDGIAYYEKLAQENVEIAKCVLDLGSYTKQIRAKILYNHIYTAGLPPEYIDAFLKDRRYHRIIVHPNFNPRIIEIFIDKNQYRNVPPEKFMDTFVDLLQHPHDVWRMAFDQLNDEARYALLVLVTMRSEVSIDDWHKAFVHFCNNSGINQKLKTDEFTWRRLIKTLSNCFIKTSKTANKLTVTPFNPSVKDFAVSLIQGSVELQQQLLQGVYFVEQLIEIFGINADSGSRYNGKVSIDNGLIPLAVNMFIKHLTGENHSCNFISIGNDFIPLDVNLPYFAYRFLLSYNPIDSNMNAMISRPLLDMVRNDSGYLKFKLMIINQMKWPESRELLRSISSDDHNIDIDTYPVLLKTMKETGNGDLINDEEFVDNMDHSLMAYADSSINNELEYSNFEDTLNEIVINLPDGLTLENAKQALYDAHDRVHADKEVEEDDDAYDRYRDFDFDEDNARIDYEIDCMMGSLRSSE